MPSRLRRIGSQVNIDDFDQPTLERELVQLESNYRHLTEYCETYKDETEWKIHKQNQTICKLIDERSLLEKLLGNFSRMEKVTRDRNRVELTQRYSDMKAQHDDMKVVLDELRKDNEQLEELKQKLLSKRKEMGGINGPFDYRIRQCKRRRNLENRKNKLSMLLNDTLAENKHLRDKVNHIRIERAAFQKQYRKFAFKLEECKQRKSDILANTSLAADQRQEALTKIHAHRERDNKQWTNFEQAMKVLDRVMCHEQKLNNCLTVKANDRLSFKQREADKHEKDARETLTADTKTLDEYRESYNCILEVAELNSLDAVIARFLDQEAANFALFNYVTDLNGENELLVDQVRAVEMEIDKMKRDQEAADEIGKQKLKVLEEEHRKLLAESARSMHQLTEVNHVLDQFKNLIHKTFDKVGCSVLDVEQLLGLNVEISIKNMAAYLGQIESRANQLLNILHYVNLKESDLTGLTPARVDVTDFALSASPAITAANCPNLEDKWDDDSEDLFSRTNKADLRPWNKEEMIVHAAKDIIQRNHQQAARLNKQSTDGAQ